MAVAASAAVAACLLRAVDTNAAGTIAAAEVRPAVILTAAAMDTTAAAACLPRLADTSAVASTAARRVVAAATAADTFAPVGMPGTAAVTAAAIPVVVASIAAPTAAIEATAARSRGATP